MLESITRASGEQIKTLALRIEQMTRIAYVSNAPDMRNAQMKDALVKALDRHKLNTNSTITPTINNLSCDIINLTVEDMQIMEQDIAHDINVVRHKYSNDPFSEILQKMLTFRTQNH